MYCNIFTGSYAEAGAPGIQMLQLNLHTGRLSHLHSCCSVERPSYLALSPDNATLYAVSETAVGGSIYALSTEPGRCLSVKNHLATSGGAACHVAVDPMGQYLLVSNYISGILDAFRLLPSGEIDAHTCAIQFSGSGPVQSRQEQAHAHFAAFFPEDPNRVIAVDLGSDLLRLLTLDRDTGKPEETGCIRVPAGYGPRHLVFSRSVKNIVYLVCELSLRVLTVKIEAHSGVVLQNLPCVPDDYVLDAGAGAIKLSEDGRFLYASTRVYHAQQGTDCVVCYGIDAETGQLCTPEFTELDGSVPRDIHPVDDYLLVACQDSDRITVYPCSPDTGRLQPAVQTYPLYRPSCLIRCVQNQSLEKE